MLPFFDIHKMKQHFGVFVSQEPGTPREPSGISFTPKNTLANQEITNYLKFDLTFEVNLYAGNDTYGYLGNLVSPQSYGRTGGSYIASPKKILLWADYLKEYKKFDQQKKVPR